MNSSVSALCLSIEDINGAAAGGYRLGYARASNSTGTGNASPWSLTVLALPSAGAFGSDWQRQTFGPQSPRGLATADPDADELLNVHEWYFGGDPLLSDAGRLPSLEIAADGSHWLRFRQRPGSGPALLRLMASADIRDWHEVVTDPWQATSAGETLVPLGRPASVRRFYRWQPPGM